VSIILLFAAKPMVQFLSGSSEPVVLNNGARYLQINGPFYAVLGVLLNLRNSLQGLGSKIVPLVSSIIEFIGKILFVIFLIPVLNYLGVIICEPVIWCFMCAQLIWAFYRHPYIKKR
jgi:Na+-driven multidrug efflux pump